MHPCLVFANMKIAQMKEGSFFFTLSATLILPSLKCEITWTYHFDRTVNTARTRILSLLVKYQLKRDASDPILWTKSNPLSCIDSNYYLRHPLFGSLYYSSVLHTMHIDVDICLRLLFVFFHCWSVSTPPVAFRFSFLAHMQIILSSFRVKEHSQVSFQQI